MIEYTINKEQFKFKYLPDYAAYLLANQLHEFVTVGIRFAKEIDLPLLKPLSKYSEKELVDLSIDSNRKILEALIKNEIAAHIEESTRNWIDNTLSIVDKDDIAAEDLTLVFYLRRKNFAYFLDAYTKNVVLQKFIIAELDLYTTNEELIAYNVYLKMQQEKLAAMNTDLTLYKELLLEAQELGGMGSFLTHFKDETKSFYTPEYRKIFEVDNRPDFEEFLKSVHPDDRQILQTVVDTAYRTGGRYEIEYRYNKNASEKRIWSKGFIIAEDGAPVLIRGIVRDVTDTALAS